MATSLLTRESALQALRTVQDPDLHQDIVTLGMVRALEIQGTNASLTIVLTTPACPMKEKIQSEAETALKSLAGAQEVKILMTSEVRSNRAAAGAARPGAQQGGSQPIAGVTHVIAVSSGKGGVGKSTVAVNLATSLALEGARVGLMDSDVYGPNIPTMMGVIEGPKIEQDPERGDVFVPPSSHGVKVMSMGFLIDADQPLVWRGPMLHNIVSQFCHKVNWGTLDYLIVDMPPGTGDVQLSMSQLVPMTGAVLVTTPQEVSAQDVRKAYNMFDKVRIPVLGIVENMSHFVCNHGERYDLFGNGGGVLLSKKYKVPLLAQLPLVMQVREGGDDGKPVVIGAPNSPAALAFRELARKVAQQVSIVSAKTGTETGAGIQIGKFE